MSNTPQVLVVAAEASSSLYAQRLMQHFKRDHPEVHFFGIGSRAMEELGFECLGRSEELAVMGLSEVLSHFKVIKDTFYLLLKETEKRRPKFVLLLDYPEFNLKLAGRLKKLGIPIVYYISPQIWAWRRGRVKLIKKLVSKMLVLFPFEKDFYESFGVKAEFVGHPLLDEIKEELFAASSIAEARSRYGLRPNQRLLALMPGSRLSELKYNLETQLQTASMLVKKFPDLRAAILMAPSLSHSQIVEHLPAFDFPLMILQGEPMQMIRLTDVVLCASGTATLVVGLMKKPMVVMYKMNPLTAWIARFLIKGRIPFFSMVNLISGRKVVEECFQSQADPHSLSLALGRLLEDEQYYRETEQSLADLHLKLGSRGATERVAKSLEEFL